MTLRAAGAALVIFCVVATWLAVVVGGALQSIEWVRRCPVCHLTLRKSSARERFRCGRCGWAE